MKFFNHIRRRLLKRNRFGNYMLYAIGEIILVVIGILIAIQLDEMKNEQEILKRQDLFITQLKRDLDESKRALKRARRQHDSAQIITHYITHAYWKPELQHDSLYEYFLEVLNLGEIYKPNTGTINSLVYSGNIELIRSFQVRNSLLVYLERVTAMLEEIRLTHNKVDQSINGIRGIFDPSSFRRLYQRKTGFKYSNNMPDAETLKRINWRPDYKTIPFPMELEQLFSKREVYSGYIEIASGHGIMEGMYRELIDETDNLQRVLEQEGY